VIIEDSQKVREHSAATDPTIWLEEHGDVLFSFALLRVRQSDVAEDLVQETLLAALQGRAKFSGRSSVRTWLVGILRRKIIDHFRRRSQPGCVQSEHLAPSQAEFDNRGHWRYRVERWPRTPAEEMEKREFWLVFERCLSKLPATQAEVFCLRELDDLNSQEACEILGITPTNLGVCLYRARASLRRCLELNWFSEPSS